MTVTTMKPAAVVILALSMFSVSLGLAVATGLPPVPNPKGDRQVAKLAEVKPAEGPVDQAAVAAANNRFGFELLGQVARSDQNAFLSPYSISAALSMTYAGARGPMAAEMARTLHCAPDQAHWHPAFAALRAALQPGGKEPAYQLHIANRLWGQSGHPFEESFLKITRDDYGASIQPLDFKTNAEVARQTINRWVEEQTKDKIKELIAPRVLTPDTRLVLTNAIYFQSAWQHPFTPGLTKPDDFNTGVGKVQVPMMHITASFGYAETEMFQVVSLPYQANALSMVVILPKGVDLRGGAHKSGPSPRNGLAAVGKDLTAARLHEVLGKLKPERVEVSLPKFKLLESYDLGQILARMGMPKAFSSREADFSGISRVPDEPLFIGNVIHKALVDVDEKGTEAAAATAVIMKAGAVRPRPQQPVVFKADHPFLFLIRENRTGTVLFLGRLVTPAA